MLGRYIDKKRIYWVDWLKMIAILAVILVHCSSKYLLPETVFQPNWYLGVLFESCSRFGVPLFIMVSGFLILRKNQSIADVPRRLKRIIVPFLFWLVICVLAKFIFMFKVNGVADLGFFLVGALLDPTIVSVEFWFVYMIIGLYILSPIITTWLYNANIREIEYAIIVWALISFVGFSNVEFLLYDYLRYFTGSIGYFILGYYLVAKQKSCFRNRNFGWLLFISGTLLAFFGTVFASMVMGTQSLLFFNLGDITPSACLQAMGLFIIISNTDFNKFPRLLNKIALYLSLGSYGVYLSNVLFINLFDKLRIFDFLGSAAIIVPLEFILVVLVTNIVIRLMYKIPFLKKYSGIV